MSNKTIIESHNTTITNNNITIDDILETINNLPEAGGGSGGGVETVTVIPWWEQYGVPTQQANYAAFATVYENGVIKNAEYSLGTSDEPLTPLDIPNVVVGSNLIIMDKNNNYPVSVIFYSGDGTEVVFGSHDNVSIAILEVPSGDEGIIVNFSSVI